MPEDSPPTSSPGLGERDDPAWLLSYRSNSHSQFGEDGVISRVLDLLPERDLWCVEFGASDGIYLSNTRSLILDRGYSAVLIEGDPSRYARLRENYADEPRVIALQRMVGWEPENGLDSILSQTPIPREFDFLSIDIDGNDIHAWRSLSHYRPRLVCIEFNPTVPPGVFFTQPANAATQQGSSLEAINAMAKDKGYELVAVLRANAFFIDKCHFGAFGIIDNSPAALRREVDLVTYLFSGYDGTVFLRGNQTLPWHHLPLREEHMQLLPRFLRKYPSSYRRLHRILLVLVLLMRDRRTIAQKIAKRFRRQSTPNVCRD